MDCRDQGLRRNVNGSLGTKHKYLPDVLEKVKIDALAFAGRYDPNIFIIG